MNPKEIKRKIHKPDDAISDNGLKNLAPNELELSENLKIILTEDYELLNKLAQRQE